MPRGSKIRLRSDSSSTRLGVLVSGSRTILAIVLIGGCVPSQAAKNSGQAAAGRHIEVDSPTTVVSPNGVTDVETILAEAEIEFASERFEQAAEKFEFVVEVAQKPRERLRGLLGWGTSLDALGRPQEALSVYDRYVAESQEGALRDEIRVRQVRLLTFMEQYRDAAAIAARVSTEQAPLAQIALLSSQALFALSEGRDEDAELSIARGRTVVEGEGYDRLGTVPRDVAALYFALGELRRKKGQAIEFDPLPEDFPAALEARCQWILDAQSAYSQAMRAQDAHWSAMAGVSVGRLYHELHQELMGMPQPMVANTDQRRELFEGALRLRYAILLTKAASMLRATLALRDKDQAHGLWVKRAEETLAEIERAEQEEERAISDLPYTKPQLQQALDDLARRAVTGGSKMTP